MSSPPILWHTAASRAPNAPEVSPAEWTKYRELLKQLYIDNNKTLEDVMEYMKKQHDFRPSKRQYTRQLSSWRYFKNKSRHRSQRMGNDNVSLLAEPALRALSQPSPSELDPYPVTSSNGGAEEDMNKDGSSLVSQSLAESDPDVLAGEYYASKVHNATVDPPASRGLAAGGLAIGTIDEGHAETLAQEQESTPNDAMLLPKELFEDSVPLSVRAPKNPAVSRSLSIIEEEQPTPSLSRASRPSTDESDSIETASLSSFGGVDDIHVLMDLDDEDAFSLPMIRNKESAYGTGIQSPYTPSEESVARLSKVYRVASGFDNTRDGGMKYLDPKARSIVPVFMQMAESTRSYSPSKVLSKIRQYRTKQVMTVADFNQISSIADFYTAARSYSHAFKLYRFVFDRTMARPDSSLSPAAIYRAGINVAMTATSADNYKEVAGLMRNVMSKREDFLSPITIEACLLHSHLGNNFRARNDLEAAERHCRLGLNSYSRYYNSTDTWASRTILATNLVLVLEDKGEAVTARPLDDYLHPAWSISLTFRTEVDEMLSNLLYWCHDAIAEQDLQALSGLIQGCSDDFWTQGSSNDLKEFEITLLFCHLWKRWRLSGEGLHKSRQYRDCHSLLGDLEKDLGIVPVDALAALSIMIMSLAGSEVQQYSQKSRLARRILFSSQEASTADRTRLFSDFLTAHTAPLRTKFKVFSTDEYTTMVQGFVQGFADLHLQLHLSEAAFQDPGLRPKPNRSSSSSSLTPTMLSTPRSSWSGYASFKRTSWLAKSSSSQIANEGRERPSTSSSSLRHRLSLSGSFNSFRTSRSSSFMNVDPEDVIMEDVG